MVLKPLLETSLRATARLMHRQNIHAFLRATALLTWLCIVGKKYVRQWWHQRGVWVTCDLHLTRNLISQNTKK